ncbi:hypothetical protein L9F63_009361, partial [Diploptera punctata]
KIVFSKIHSPYFLSGRHIGPTWLLSPRLTRVLFPALFSEFSFYFTLTNTHTW